MKLNSILTAGLAAACVVLAVAPASAHPHRRRDGIGRERARIRAGVANGSITKKEAHHLWANERSLRAQRSAYNSDGYLTASERNRMKEEQMKQNRLIWNMRHNHHHR